MKKLVLFLFVLISLSVNSQGFKLLPIGFVDSEDETKDFIVLNFDGKSKKEIYDLAHAKVVGMFVSAKDVVSNSGEDVLTINGVSNKAISFNGAFNYTMNYTLVLLFKDGKLRVNAPSLNNISGTFGDVNNRKQLLIQGSGGAFLPYQYVFNKNGELKREKNKAELEQYFNGLIQEIKKGVEVPSNW